MSDKMEELKNIIIKKRKEIFKQNKFEKYVKILDSMQIPEKFNYKDCIPNVFSDTRYKEIKKFKINPYNTLYKEVLRYTNCNKLNLDEEIIIVVHPFYPIIRHANFLIQFPDYYEKYIKYEKNILKLLNNKNLNIVLFESPDNFARYTYKFYDSGSVKKVVFTEHSTGIVLNKNDLFDLKKCKKAKVVGCYGNNCVLDVKKQLSNINFIDDEELILERAIKL